MIQKRSLSPNGLLFTSVSAILGSGWMFSAYYTSQLAGPAAIISWILGGILLIIIAFTFAEISAMLPLTGSSVRVPQYTHGTLVAFIFSWFIWLSYTALVPTEVQGVIQYLTLFFPSLALPNTGQLTHQGYITATFLMLIISSINIYSLRWLIRANNALTIMKIILPIILVISIFMIATLHHHPLYPRSDFSPYGFHGIFAAIASGGIIFAFNGFKQACEMAGEAKNPGTALPYAIIGSITLCLTIYLLLQLAFLTSLQPTNISKGWANIQLSHSNSPFTTILLQDHLQGLLPLLYLGAIIGPLAAALMYMASSSRSLYATSANGCLPNFLHSLNHQGNPAKAILVNFCVGMLMFTPLPGWKAMVTFLTSLMAISYVIGPISLLALRYQIPNQSRLLKLPFPRLWSYTAFFLCNCLAYWSGWDIISKLSLAIIAGIIILFGYRTINATARSIPLNSRCALWLWPYFGGLTLISYLGSFGHGINLLPFGWDILTVLLFSLGIMWLAIHLRLAPEETQCYIDELEHHLPKTEQ
ncbi:MAG: amino acid permease [Legionellales bacterium]|nr:amino acid permease [Legionellales bacterium]HAG62134.1 amino acid permease [Coxiellaceae bacterium]